MGPPGASTPWPMPRWRWLVWLVYVAALSAALLAPVPSAEPLSAELGVDVNLYVSKTVHVVAYALLAALAGWVRAPVRWRWLLAFVVAGHGTLMELFQSLTPHRSGALADVVLDQLGVGLGLLLSWKWWCAPDSDRDSERGT
jgi:VanZ family protein